MANSVGIVVLDLFLEEGFQIFKLPAEKWGGECGHRRRGGGFCIVRDGCRTQDEHASGVSEVVDWLVTLEEAVEEFVECLRGGQKFR